MTEAAWARSAPRTSHVDSATTTWHGQVRTAAEASHARMRLRSALVAEEVPEDTECRVLLAFEELVSNGVRHGRPPVIATVIADDGWLLQVSDAAPNRPPVPALDRDAAAGGMGLGIVARMATAYGWTVEGGRKTVWAWIRSSPPANLESQRDGRDGEVTTRPAPRSPWPSPIGSPGRAVDRRSRLRPDQPRGRPACLTGRPAGAADQLSPGRSRGRRRSS